MNEQKKSRYISLAGCFWDGSDDVQLYSTEVVRTRKMHSCPGNCNGETHPIPIGSYAVRETARCDGKMASAYTCLGCLDRWAKEIGDVA
jgi:hypothetical protein